MAIVKRCHQCQAWFPASVGSWVNYCPKCLTPTVQAKLLQIIKKTRIIPFVWFDIWDTQYPVKSHYYPYEYVCRICGKRLVGKKGQYLKSRKYCNDPCYSYDTMKQYTWTTVRHIKLHANYRKRDHGHHCEFCGKIMVKKYGIDNPPVHHKVPVHTLDWANIGFIWDLSNLVVLCPACHKQQDHRLKHCEKPSKRHQFKDMTGYLEKSRYVK